MYNYIIGSLNEVYEMASSWVVVNKQTGKAVIELWDYRFASKVDLSKYDVLPIKEWLYKMSREASQNA